MATASLQGEDDCPNLFSFGDRRLLDDNDLTNVPDDFLDGLTELELL